MLWGGRFKEKLDEKALKFSSSLRIDINLILEDINGSKAHAEMLAKSKIIPGEDAQKIIKGLELIEKEWRENIWRPDENKFEDIHSAVEARLFELIGEPAGRLHTGRSRNDQIATDVQLWIRKICDVIIDSISNFQTVLVKTASGHSRTLIPGYTHLQRAQPISLAFHLLAYVEMLQRDKERFGFVKSSLKQSPLGSGALAGSTLPLDRDYTSQKLGFEFPSPNALDSVSNRDFILDFLNACSVGMMHLSRLSEELIIWSTTEWNFVKIGDKFTTGSSLMPQKKNPDLAELIRGKTGRIYGNYINLATTMKSLPLSYNRDLQEDKEPLVDSFLTYGDSLDIMSSMLQSAQFNVNRFEDEMEGDFSLATDLADWLVLKGVPFREAHRIVGKVVKMLEDAGRNFKEIKTGELKKIDEIFDETALAVLNIKTALERKKTFGSPNPDIVLERIIFWKKELNISN